MKKNYTIICSALLLPVSAFAAVNAGDSIDISNNNPLTTVKTSDGTEILTGWLRVGYLNDWNGTTPLTGTQIKNDWVSVGSIPFSGQKATLGQDGVLANATYTFNDDDDSAAVLGGGTNAGKAFLVLLGNGTDFKSGDNTEIAVLTFSAGAAVRLTWEALNPGATLALDWTTPSENSGSENLTPGMLFGSYSGDIMLAAIPEPSMFGLLAGLSALALVGARRRRK